MRLTENSFNGLSNLIKLEIIECYTSEKIICFDSLNNLKFLRIKYLSFDIELKPLENLKVLIIEIMDDLDNIINHSENITYLQLYSLNVYVSTADEFFSRLCVPNLIYLNMSYTVLTDHPLLYLKEQWVNRIQFLKELILHENQLENVDFCRFDCLVYLEKLDLSLNFIKKLDEGAFSKLKRLKWLNLNSNQILELGSNKFLGLRNLEYLFLSGVMNERMKFDGNRIEKDAFNGLTNLKKLSLDWNSLEYIDPEAFSHTPKLNELSLKHNRLESIDPKVFSYTPKLVELKICANNMKIEENIFENLKHLKKIELSESDEEHINNNILEDLKKSKNGFIIKINKF